MKSQTEETFDFQWEDDESLHDPEHLARLKVEVMEGIMRSLNDPRPDLTSEEMRAHIKEFGERIRRSL